MAAAAASQAKPKARGAGAGRKARIAAVSGARAGPGGAGGGWKGGKKKKKKKSGGEGPAAGPRVALESPGTPLYPLYGKNPPSGGSPPRTRGEDLPKTAADGGDGLRAGWGRPFPRAGD